MSKAFHLAEITGPFGSIKKEVNLMVINKKRGDYFSQFINWFWLRPENALMVSLRAEKYAETLKFFDQDSSIDVSCGDGVFSFVTLGGEISASSDMFRSVNLNKDRYGNFDTFDHFDKTYFVEVAKHADYQYTVGSDWKENLLKKSEKLDFYKNLLLHDNNKKFEFGSNKFGYVYSNSAYWINNFEEHLKDLERITKPGGYIVLEMKTDKIKEYNSLNYGVNIIGHDAAALLDAGRLSTWKGLKSLTEIDDILANLQYCEVINRSPIYGDYLGYMWDVGLRPIFKPLAKMVSLMSDESRSEVKAEMSEIFTTLGSQVLEKYEANEATAMEWLYVIRKK